MGSIRFVVETLSVDCVYGQPWHLVKVQKKEEGDVDRGIWAFEKDNVPDELQLVFRAMRTMNPPEDIIKSSFGMRVPSSMVDAMFGVGRRSGATLTYLPTDLVSGGYRAWVLFKEWYEGGGEGWFGEPIHHKVYCAGFWLNEEAAQKWAEELAEHPLGKFLVQYEKSPYDVFFQAGVNPAAWEGVEILFYSGYNNPEYIREYHPDFSVGVYHKYQVRFGRWEGSVLVHAPELWEVRFDDERKGYPLVPHYPLLRVSNGMEEQLFVATAEDAVAENQYRYLNHLPNRRAYCPTDASGEWATFWPNDDEWEKFAFSHHIMAKQAQLGLHAPWPSESGAILIPLTREWAEFAWQAGAARLPEVIGEVPPLSEWELKGENPHYEHSTFQVGGVQGYCFGKAEAGTMIWMQTGGGNCATHHRGWVRIPVDRQVKNSFGISVRDVGDETRDMNETVVFTDGRVHLVK